MPAANKPLVLEEHEAGPPFAAVKSPKSVALPVEAIVMKSMTLDVEPPNPPPPNTPLVVEEHAPGLNRATVKSPKSVELPVVAMVM